MKIPSHGIQNLVMAGVWLFAANMPALLFAADANELFRVSTLSNGVGTPIVFNQPGGVVDGTGSDARLSFPVGVAVDDAGAVYVADMGNNRVRVVVPLAAPVIETHPSSRTMSVE